MPVSTVMLAVSAALLLLAGGVPSATAWAPAPKFSTSGLFAARHRLTPPATPTLSTRRPIRRRLVFRMAAATSAAPRGVCWDVDGTLADSFLLGYSATKDVLHQAGYAEPSGDEYHAYCIYTTPVRLARHAGLEPGTDDFERIGADLGRKFDDMYIDLVSTDTAAFFPGVLEIVEGLGSRKVPLGALTNAAVGYAEAVLTVRKPTVVAPPPSQPSWPRPFIIQDRLLRTSRCDIAFHANLCAGLPYATPAPLQPQLAVANKPRPCRHCGPVEPGLIGKRSAHDVFERPRR